MLKIQNLEIKNYMKSAYPQLAAVLKEKAIYINIESKNKNKSEEYNPDTGLWFIFEEQTRHIIKDKEAFTIPFYRSLTKDGFELHLARILNFNLVPHKFGSLATLIDPFLAGPATRETPVIELKKYEYNPQTKISVQAVRRNLQQRSDFNKNKSIIKFENYYTYNGKLVDIHNRLHSLNTKQWNIEAKILRKYKENYDLQKIA